MKQTSRISIVILMLIIGISSCKEDVYTDWKIKNQQWLENNKTQTDVITSPSGSGLQYKVIYQGWAYNRKPNANSVVKVTFKGTLIDGSTFESGTEAILDLAIRNKGWKEGIPKMNGGGKYIFYVPSSLGNDTISSNTMIPPHSTLIYEVNLIDSYN